MSSSYSPVSALVSETMSILERANAEGVPLRLLGGLAFHLRCPSLRTDARLQRSYSDIDFVTLSQCNTRVKAVFSSLGYVGNKTFNALNGHQRLLFSDESQERKIDIFLDRMQMCHTLDFRSRLQMDQQTLSVTDLLLTKLQIVELNEKDINDMVALFIDYKVMENDEGINASYIGKLTAHDWGFYKTCTLNLQKIQSFLVTNTFPADCANRVEQVLAALELSPKSFKWKTRAAIGERIRWYEIPEEAP